MHYTAIGSLWGVLILKHGLLSPLRPFPTEDSVEDEDIYNHLEDLIEYALHPFVSSHILKNILRWISNTRVTF